MSRALDEKAQALKDIEACLDEAVSYLVDLAGSRPDKNSPNNCRVKIDQALFYARHLNALSTRGAMGGEASLAGVAQQTFAAIALAKQRGAAGELTSEDFAVAAHGSLLWRAWEDAGVVLAALGNTTGAEPGWEVENSNGKQWRIVGPGGQWTMQPVGLISADEAKDICLRAAGFARPPLPETGEKVL